MAQGDWEEEAEFLCEQKGEGLIVLELILTSSRLYLQVDENYI